MVFSSPVFLFAFLPIIYLLHLAAPAKTRNGLLLLASLFFYGWGEPLYVLLMVVLSVLNYFLARGLDLTWQRQAFKFRKIIMVTALVVNLGTLIVFKYTDFLIRTINQLTPFQINETGLPLPIGISFFIFQAMSYVIDVYRHQTKVQKRFVHLMLYISFFPQLIAGPIIKYHDIAAQINQRKLTLDKTTAGLRRFMIGLAKKLLLANYTGLIADQIYSLPTDSLTMVAAWLGGFAYMLQIYFDFSGYSDMAIGLGNVFGFDFKENFNYPYVAASVQDFWRRWHISLSTWFKEYLYVPLGGNRQGLLRTGLNRVIVFFLTGLWHGASWNFVIWGLIHGLFLLLETYKIIRPEKFWRPVRHVYTLLVVLLTFVIFRAETFTQTLSFFKAMFIMPGLHTVEASALLMRFMSFDTVLMLLIAIICTLPIGRWLNRKPAAAVCYQKVLKPMSYVVVFILFLFCLMALAAESYNPFIYFRF